MSDRHMPHVSSDQWRPLCQAVWSQELLCTLRTVHGGSSRHRESDKWHTSECDSRHYTPEIHLRTHSSFHPCPYKTVPAFGHPENKGERRQGAQPRRVSTKSLVFPSNSLSEENDCNTSVASLLAVCHPLRCNYTDFPLIFKVGTVTRA